MAQTRMSDKHGMTVEPAVLDRGRGPVACFIVRDRYGNTVSPAGPRARLLTKPEELAALGVDLATLEMPPC